MHLQEFLIDRYWDQGWKVYTEPDDINAQIDGGWSGTLPDMLIVKGNTKTAVSIETESDFTEDNLPKKWSGMLANAGVSLRVVVREKQLRDRTREIAAQYAIPLECKLYIKESHRRTVSAKNLLRKRNRILTFTVVALTVIVLVLIYLAIRGLS